MRNIRQNLFFVSPTTWPAFRLQPACCIPFFGLLLSPVVAAAAMALSSVSVIGNALRLRSSNLQVDGKTGSWIDLHQVDSGRFPPH
jgi:Cu+-exporting ATPase